jgi:N-acetylneuraminate synthase
MKPVIHLGATEVTSTSPPYIIAEIGVNHEGSLDRARRLIDLAKEGGAHAAKFQSYKAGSLASRHSPAYWDTSKERTLSQYELFQKYDRFEPGDYAVLASHCRSVGIEFLSTPFDAVAVEFLTPLMPFFKIASADLTNVPMLRQVAATGKPVVLSTGASTLAEVDLALETLAGAGCREVALLHCILNYPTPIERAHLRMIEGLRRAYPEFVIGYSDHTPPDEAMTALLTAYLTGAVILEKHFTDDKMQPGNDHYHAMDTSDLRRFVDLVGRARLLLGDQVHKAPIADESISRKNARRSIVVARPIPSGQTLTEADMTYKRPGTGISPLHWDDVVGRRAIGNLEPDHVLQWQDLAK